jgi:hypothetical protein
MALPGLFGSVFKPSSNTCGYANTSKTVVLFARLPECGSEPREYVFTTDGATALSAGTINLFIKTIDGAAPAVGSKVFLSKGKRLKFGTNFVTVTNDIDVTTTAAPGTAVSIDPAPAAIATATDSAISWETSRLAGIQSVGYSRQDNLQENAEMEDFYTGDVVLGSKVTIPILMHQREGNIVWKRIIYPSIADPSSNVFAIVAKAAMPAIWGQWKVTGADAPGESRTKVMHNFTLSSQGFLGHPNQYPSEMDTTTKALYDSILERAGLPTALTVFD